MELVEKNLEMSKRFVEGLKNYDLTKEEIQDWYYVGGGHTNNPYRNMILNQKYLRYYPKAKIPPLTDECVCGHRIQENAFISNGKQLLILGSCCVKRFTEKGTKQVCKGCKQLWKGKSVYCKKCKYRF